MRATFFPSISPWGVSVVPPVPRVPVSPQTLVWVLLFHITFFLLVIALTIYCVQTTRRNQPHPAVIAGSTLATAVHDTLTREYDRL